MFLWLEFMVQLWLVQGFKVPLGWFMVFFSGWFKTYLIWDLFGIGLGLGVVLKCFLLVWKYLGLVCLVFLWSFLWGLFRAGLGLIQVWFTVWFFFQAGWWFMWGWFADYLGLVGFSPIWFMMFFEVRLGFLRGLLKFILAWFEDLSCSCWVSVMLFKGVGCLFGVGLRSI